VKRPAPHLNRRQLLQGLALVGAACTRPGAGDSAAKDWAAKDSGAGGCTSDGTGTSTGYCLVEGLVMRVFGAAGLAVGAFVLANLDDNTAVLVGRDARGIFARSAICTHACCIVALCDDVACASPQPTPDTCGTAGPSTADRVLCPWHGSIFRVSDGAALTGPATVSLPAYALSVDGPDVLVDTTTEVDPSARTPA